MLIIAFAAFALVRTVGRFRAGELTRTALLLWGAFWVAVTVVTLLPDVTTWFARLIGVGRGVDAVIYFAIIFNRRINDLEVTVQLYDITKTKRFVESFSLWLAKRGERSVTGTLKLPRDADGSKFRANTKILMKVVGSSSKKTLATTWFRIRGKVQKYKGKVTFTVAETKGLPSGSQGMVKRKKPPRLEDKGSPDCPAKGEGRLLVWGCGSFL